MNLTKNRLIYLFLIFESLFISLNNSFVPFGRKIYSYDSSTFAYVGWNILKGKIPYVDTWDNKGPFLYFINAIGIQISSEHGIWFIELLFIVTAIIFCHLALSNWFSKLSSFITTSIVFLPLSFLMEAGNITEVYALPLIFISIYIFSLYFKNNYSFKVYQLVLLGIFNMLTILLRPNLIVIWVAFCSIIFLFTLMNKKIILCLKYILFFIIGNILAFSPFFIYLKLNNALYDYFYASFLFNTQQVDTTIIQTLKAGLEVLFNFADYGLLALFFSSCAVLFFLSITDKEFYKKNIFLISIILLSFFGNFFANAITRANFLHYSISYLPIFAIFIALLFDTIHKGLNKSGVKLHPAIPLLILAIILSVPTIKLSFKTMSSNLNSESYYQLPVNVITNYIIENTKETDKIQIYGHPFYYYNSKRECSSKFFYILRPSAFSNSVYTVEESFNDTIKSLPKLIMIEDSYEDYFKNSINNIKNGKEFFELLNEKYDMSYQYGVCKFYLLKE